jgi:hypothetical protein
MALARDAAATSQPALPAVSWVMKALESSRNFAGSSSRRTELLLMSVSMAPRLIHLEKLWSQNICMLRALRPYLFLFFSGHYVN